MAGLNHHECGFVLPDWQHRDSGWIRIRQDKQNAEKINRDESVFRIDPVDPAIDPYNPV
jgi:hypothetical protein